MSSQRVIVIFGSAIGFGVAGSIVFSGDKKKLRAIKEERARTKGGSENKRWEQIRAESEAVEHREVN